MATITISPTGFATERWMRMPGLVTTGQVVGDLFAFSGHAEFNDSDPEKGMVGEGGDDTAEQMNWLEYDAELVVGPLWRLLRGVSPIVVIGGHSQLAPDHADGMGFRVQGITQISLIQPQGQAFSRIQLNVSVAVRGGIFGKIISLAYQGTAWGTLGQTGIINAPFGSQGVFFPGFFDVT